MFLAIPLKSRLCEKSTRSEVGVCKKKATELESFSSGQTSPRPHCKAGRIKWSRDQFYQVVFLSSPKGSYGQNGQSLVWNKFQEQNWSLMAFTTIFCERFKLIACILRSDCPPGEPCCIWSIRSLLTSFLHYMFCVLSQEILNRDPSPRPFRIHF